MIRDHFGPDSNRAWTDPAASRRRQLLNAGVVALFLGMVAVAVIVLSDGGSTTPHVAGAVGAAGTGPSAAAPSGSPAGQAVPPAAVQNAATDRPSARNAAGGAGQVGGDPATMIDQRGVRPSFHFPRDPDLGPAPVAAAQHRRSSEGAVRPGGVAAQPGSASTHGSSSAGGPAAHPGTNPATSPRTQPVTEPVTPPATSAQPTTEAPSSTEPPPPPASSDSSTEPPPSDTTTPEDPPSSDDSASPPADSSAVVGP